MVNLDPLSQTFFFADDSIVFAKSDLRVLRLSIYGSQYYQENISGTNQALRANYGNFNLDRRINIPD